MRKTFFEPLKEYEEVGLIKESLKKDISPLQVTGCGPVQKSHFMQAVGSDYKFKIVVTYNDVHGRELFEQMKTFDENCYFYPSKDFIFNQADIKGKTVVRERMRVVERILKDMPATIILSIDALLEKRLPLKSAKDSWLHLEEAMSLDLKKMAEDLTQIGYDKTDSVTEPGEFTIHGGILDVYPLSSDAPVRIELWGDEIDTIRLFDPESQRSIENISGVNIFPAAEHVLNKKEIEHGLERLKQEFEAQADIFFKEFKTEEAARLRNTYRELAENIEFMYYAVNLDSYITAFSNKTVTLIDYFEKDDTLFFLDEPSKTKEHSDLISLEFAESMEARLKKGYAIPTQADCIVSPKKIYAALSNRRLITISTISDASFLKPKKKFDINTKQVPTYQSDFNALVADLNKYKKQKYRILLVSASKSRAKRLAEDLFNYDINAFYSEDEERVPAPGEIMVTYGNLRNGFEYPFIKFVIIAESDVFGGKKQLKRAAKKPSGKKLLEFNNLAIGDYVIHENHGMAIYQGIQKIESDGVTKDYIKLQYGGGGILYVPVTSLDLLQKYADADADKKPKLNKLNSPEWGTTKQRVKASVNEIAKELVDLYAIRSNKKGFAFSEDTIWQREFEELFPYEETTDQLRAIEDTKKDMMSSKIMDRLVCGDVGYGKTEIAIRAAFKAVQDSKQVAVLVPTTILAQQHYNTFIQRFKDFPVKIELLCRFRTAKEIKETIAKLRRGEVDIVIGTHRLLSKDVVYKNLGLLVIDEEQRFGVTHKEKLKLLKNEVDVLTLTATPIPRTMHMSLIGIRDMSILDEPPIDRLPIQTYVLEHDDEMIREAITREVNRGGQIYYVSNKVAGIDDVAARLQSSLGEDVVVRYAHGRMNERQLEDIMLSFINGEIDVLVSTTIIETGMDIPNVNTIIIDNADKFGLSQLYQLRGRVGRSNRTAYAFLMYRRDKILREEAEKRLAAIREFTELGAGYKIAMKDLEIRGAGNLLGERQSGHMSIVGYDLYCKMLNEAVGRLKGELEVESFETTIDVTFSAFIPSSYIKTEAIKLDVYKQIAGIENKTDLEEVYDELVDRFGDPPESVVSLLYVSLIRGMAKKVFITDVKLKGSMLILTIYEKAKLDVSKFPEYLKKQMGSCKLTGGINPVLTYRLRPRDQKAKTVIDLILNILEGLKELLSGEENDEENS